MKPVSPNAEWMAIHPDDKKLPPEEQTRFFFRVLDVCEEAYLDDKLGSVNDEGFHVKLGTQNLIALDVGLSRIENFKDGDKEIELKRDESKRQIDTGSDHKVRPWDRKCLSYLRKDVRTWAAKLIVSGKELEEAEVKNS